MSDTPAFVSIASASGALSADINPMGAELSALRDGEGRDLQWDGDPAVWTGRAPILFPIVGMLEHGRYRLDGKTYDLAKHGFARRKRFEVIRSDADVAAFRLMADPETLAVYPFDFELGLQFSITGARLTIRATIGNAGRTPMPASLGFHPALRWPLPYGRPRAEHTIRFERQEAASIRRIDVEGVVKPEPFATPVQGRELALRDDLFVDDALIFDPVASQRVSYGAADGPRIEVEFPATPYLGVWTKPGADFICIEPWHGIADPVGYAGDFRDKPGVFEVAPGSSVEVAMALSLVA